MLERLPFLIESLACLIILNDYFVMVNSKTLIMFSIYSEQLYNTVFLMNEHVCLFLYFCDSRNNIEI